MRFTVEAVDCDDGVGCYIPVEVVIVRKMIVVVVIVDVVMTSIISI